LFLKKLLDGKSKFFIYMLLAQLLFMLSNLFINYKIEKIWSVEGFATYNLLKRLGSFIVFPLVLGVGIGIPRYISFLKKGKNDTSQGLEYLFAGLIIFFTTFIAFLVLILLFPDLILSSFKQSDSNSIILIVALFVFSQGVFVILSSFFRGKIQFGRSSLLNVLVLSFLPTAVIFFSGTIFDYFFYYAILTIAALSIIIVFNIYQNSISFQRTKFKVRQLIHYGAPRVVGDAILFSLDFIPIYFVSVFISLEESGYLSLSFMFFKLASVSFDLIGSLILPVYGKGFKNESSAVFIKKVNMLLLISGSLAVVASILGYLLIPYLIVTFFSSLSNAILASQYVFIAFPFYVVFTILKNVLDIISHKAYNSLIQMGGFLVMVLTLFYGIYQKEWLYYRTLTIIIPYFVLGVLTYFVWNKLKYKLVHNLI
jgi:O-antigen/teichoic acid export membrane protein